METIVQFFNENAFFFFIRQHKNGTADTLLYIRSTDKFFFFFDLQIFVNCTTFQFVYKLYIVCNMKPIWERKHTEIYYISIEMADIYVYSLRIFCGNNLFSLIFGKLIRSITDKSFTARCTIVFNFFSVSIRNLLFACIYNPTTISSLLVQSELYAVILIRTYFCMTHTALYNFTFQSNALLIELFSSNLNQHISVLWLNFHYYSM